MVVNDEAVYFAKKQRIVFALSCNRQFAEIEFFF